MRSNGWIKLHRKMMEKGYYGRSTYVHLWIHLLLSANHKEKEFMWNGEMIIIKDGQLLIGREKLSKETGIPETTIEDILKVFEKEGQIRQQKTTKFRVITILNWKKYQITDNRATTERQQSDTNKNVKNEENDKKRTFSAEVISLTHEFFSMIRLNDPKAKEPNFDSWMIEMDKLIRIDGRERDEIQRVFTFATTDSFWKSNILSTKKLREKFQQLKLKMENNESNSNGSRRYHFDKTKYPTLNNEEPKS